MEVFEDKNRPDTGLVICETPANPTNGLVDLAACKLIADGEGIQKRAA